MSHSLGLQLLQLAPLVFSTINLQWARDEYGFLSAWHYSKENIEHAFTPYFASWLNISRIQPLFILPIPFITGLAAYWTLRSVSVLLRDSSLTGIGSAEAGAARWYLAGAMSALAHYLFAPKAICLLKDMPGRDFISGKVVKTSGRPLETTREWLRMHGLRYLAAEIPAFLCFAVATVKLSA